jgi:HK97 family phage major capsid protein
MAVTIEELEDKKVKLHEHAKALVATADAENRELTAEEQKELDGAQAAFGDVERDITNRRRIAEQEQKINAAAPRLTRSDGTPVPQNGATSSTPIPSGSYSDMTPKGHWGWRNLGQFAKAVRAASFGQQDPRLIVNAAAATFGSEQSQADGGYAIPPDFRQAIAKKIMGSESLLARTDQQTTTGNQITFPTDETTPWQTTGGIVVSWDQETSSGTQSKPKLGENTVRAYKLRALVPITEELLADAPALSNWLNSKVPDKMNFAVTNAIVNGTGAGQPVGLINAGCKVTVSKESGQATGTVQAANIVKMWGRCLGQWRTNGVWLINQDVEQQLQQMTLGSAGWPAYLPPGGLSNQPYATLMGRPVIVTEACKALSTEGDIILTDLNQYLSVVKTGGVQQEVSIHLWFDQDLVAFKFTLRLGGQPWWNSAITRLNGSATLTSIVTLQTR